MKKNILKSFIASICAVLTYNVIKVISGNAISIKENLIDFIVIFMAMIIVDYFYWKKRK